VPFASNAREILVNAIGCCLLNLARNQDKTISIDKPLLVFIDEAHQFLNKSTGDEYSKITLDAFGNIAKEGRKYGLNVVIATQRPRDIPEEVLSQMGTFLVHRLINPIDQDLIKKAIGDLDSTTAQALPTLATGEVLLLGVDFNFPMRIKINKAKAKIESASTNFSKVWKENKDR
jgi:DNA helicase HerA-like ATPase